jgi:glucosamine 6-phosphate synthetase-like amidotransferase/phosphosugar isomerase protein
MVFRSEIRDVPRSLKETLEKGRSEYDAIVRRTPWGDGPLYIIGSDASYPATLAGALAFEGLLGIPVIASRATNFHAYAASLIRPRTVVLAVSISGETDKTLEAALQARSRGATLLALTAGAESALAGSANDVFLVRAGEESRIGIHTELCLQAAMGFVAVVAARALKRHHPKLDELEKEYEKLPEQAESVVTRFTDAVRTLASELKDVPSLALVGGGFYFSAALQAAQTLCRLTPLRARAREVAEIGETPVGSRESAGAIMFLSGTRCRLKKEIHSCAKQSSETGVKVFAVTDGNDRELSDAASVAVLLPVLSEMTGSTLALLVMQVLASHLLHNINSSIPPSSGKGAE